jgi:polyphosphate kinase
VVRKEEGGLRSYLHLATGNYNSVTAQIYEDIGLFTCDETLISDVTHLFNYLTGYSNIQAYQKLIVAPFNLRQRLQALILQEMEYARSGQKRHIILKANSLVDPQIIRQLYEASQAGVRIDLAIRGICCLVPGVPNLSENIRVISVVGRFLEHSRIFYFYNNGDEKVFLGSADLMTRNLNYRVETVFPIEDERHIRYIRDQVLEKIFQDNCSARTLQPDGTYLRKQSITDEASINMQNWLIQHPHGNLLS